MKMMMLQTASIMMITTIMMIMMTTMSKKTMTDMQKSSPFECGFNPMSNKRLPFSIHFFMIAIIFLIFDVEIIIILPSITMMKFSVMSYWAITYTMFFIMLTMGLYYEWYNGLLNWKK